MQPFRSSFAGRHALALNDGASTLPVPEHLSIRRSLCRIHRKLPQAMSLLRMRPPGGFRGYMDAMKNAHSFSPPIQFQHPGASISDQKVKIQKHQIAVAQGEPLAPKFPQLSRLLLVAGYPH